MLLIALYILLLRGITAETNETENRSWFAGFNQQNGNRNCRSQRQEPGRCIHINQCPELYSRAQQNSRQIYSEYFCQGNLVCCPDRTERPTPKRPWNTPPQNPQYHSRPQQPQWRPPPSDNYWRPPPQTTWRPPATTENYWRPPPTSGDSWRPERTTEVRRPPTSTESVNDLFFWSTSQPTRSPPPDTTVREVVQVPKKQPQGGGSGLRTNHRNRRLLPEDSCGVDLAVKILGGEKTHLEEFPWMALLRLRFPSGRTIFMCGGSLISPRYVLTAAHCIKGSDIPRDAVVDQVRLGENNVDTQLDCTPSGVCSPTPDDVEIEERIVHPDYNPRDTSSTNDIALLRLKRSAKVSAYVQPICLPLDELTNKDYSNERLQTAGWGRTQNVPRSNSPVKLKVEVPVVPLKKCSEQYRKESVSLKESQVCAGGEAGKDSCQGDSGGPLMSLDVIDSSVRWHVTGVVSFGPLKCGQVNKPGVYTRVGSYINWILNNMKD